MQSVADLLQLPTLGAVQISPDGRQIAYERFIPEASDLPATRHLWLVPATGGAPRQITFGSGQESTPRWSPDGQTLAFLSNRGDAGRQLYLLPLAGGEAQPLVTGTGAILEFAWSPDGRQIAFLRKDEAAPEQQPKNAPIIVDDTPRYHRLWTITLATGAVAPISPADVHIWEFAWFAAGDALAVVAATDPTEAAWYRCWLARLDLADGALTTLFQPGNGRQVARPAPAPDGQHVACISCRWSDSGMSGGDLWVVPAQATSAEQPRNLTAGAAFSVNTACWLPEGATLLWDAYDGTGVSFGTVAANGAGDWRLLWHGACGFNFHPLAPSADGQWLAVQRSTVGVPPGVWLAQFRADSVEWSEVVPGGAQPAAPAYTVEDVAWTAHDGLSLGGLLVLPAERQGPVPLVVLVHGGPTGRTMHGFSSRGFAALAPILAAQGIATFGPNYRGSNGRGVAFAEANYADMGGNDWQDILAGVDHLVATGVADPERLALIGWSYGGYMAMWGVTQTPRFKVAIAGAGIANWASFHGTSDLHAWDALFYEADPYDPQGIYQERSPIYQTHRVQTPTLVLHGANDRVVPPDQGREFFRALRDRGVETQLVLYPGAGHGPHDPTHIQDLLQRSLDWLTQRL